MLRIKANANVYTFIVHSEALVGMDRAAGGNEC